ncbi:MAG: flavodoxin-dependent (E)-4-hydroxy-3-methylbut-2-enyl-diphosphate synthase [Planctomycetes bacterium]|nr:flavodoxin-dependent (E)-4-hydroxy-3-methylbut-2-enyl-diphosphate synthase [Planctomycetota bacterium]
MSAGPGGVRVVGPGGSFVGTETHGYLAPRRRAREVRVGSLVLGGSHPVRVQSMTKGDTGAVQATFDEIVGLEAAGCELVRVSVPTVREAKALGEIKRRIKIPLVADIHFSAPLALEAIAQGVDKVRINPGNIGTRDEVEKVVRAARDRGVAMRIGVNSGSIRERKALEVKDRSEDMVELCVREALRHVEIFESLRFHDFLISIKAHTVPLTVAANRLLARSCDYPIHLGVTHAGSSEPATVKSAAAFGILLAEGIGDTIRVSITGDNRQEVRVGHVLLQALGLREPTFDVYACPSCGRAEVDLIGLTKKVEEATKGLTYPCRVAVMGCIVNGPGEAAEADVSVSAGKGAGFIYRGTKMIKKVREDEIVAALRAEIDAWIAERRAAEGAASGA